MDLTNMLVIAIVIIGLVILFKSNRTPKAPNDEKRETLENDIKTLENKLENVDHKLDSTSRVEDYWNKK